MTNATDDDAQRGARETEVGRNTQARMTTTPGAAETRMRSPETPSPQDLGAGRDTYTSARQGARGAPRAPGEAIGVGQLLGGHYRLVRELGAGGMGVVYLASDEDVKGEMFAIKVLKPEIRERPEALDLVREEVRKTRTCAHPNIVGMYSVNVDGDCVFILMEYLEGKTLDTLLDEEFGRGMPFSRAWPLIQDICAGLACAHDHNVIHSDLKPSNIFVTTSGRAKLLDFGIARASRGGRGRFDPGSLGALTLAYASCEMLDGASPDQRDDVYCLGCVIYEMLTGKQPLEARAAGLRVAPIASLTRNQNASLAQALAFDRAQRTDTVEALLVGLDPKAAASQSSRARKGIWIGLGCFILLTMAGLAWFAWQRVGIGSPVQSPRPASASDPAGEQALRRVQALAADARSLDVDPSDHSLQEGMGRLSEAQQRLAAGQTLDGNRLLAQAENAIDVALRDGKRLAHLGSPANEIAVALNLCQQTGNRCAAADFSDEAPRSVALNPFELDKTVVSNGDFAKFVAAKHYVTEAERAGGLHAAKGEVVVFQAHQSWKTLRDANGSTTAAAAAQYPVRGVDFKAASDYCSWLGKRLPTEDEWEYVARGADDHIFAWGNEPRAVGSTPPRGLLPAGEQPMTGRFGTRGLGDGVLEWVNAASATDRVVRGASWLDTDPVSQRLAMRRLLTPPIYALLDTGFRCAKSAQSWPSQTP